MKIFMGNKGKYVHKSQMDCETLSWHCRNKRQFISFTYSAGIEIEWSGIANMIKSLDFTVLKK